MANQVLQDAAKRLEDIERRKKEAYELIEVLRDAGEDTSALSAELKNQENKARRFENALSKRGITVKMPE